MATVAAKLPDATARAFRKRAKEQGKTQSQLLREVVEEYLAPPSREWAQAMLGLPRLGPPRRRKPKDVDQLTWDIDTTL